MPDGGIIFISTRCDRFIPCYHTQACLLYRMDADGDNIRLLSVNNVADHRPAMLPDGRVIYTRWEYVDRAPQKFHTLWMMNPDGTNLMATSRGPSRIEPIPGVPEVIDYPRDVQAILGAIRSAKTRRKSSNCCFSRWVASIQQRRPPVRRLLLHKHRLPTRSKPPLHHRSTPLWKSLSTIANSASRTAAQRHSHRSHDQPALR